MNTIVSINHLIDNRVVAPVSGEYLDCTEPATGQVYARVASGDAIDVDAAVGAAKRAFPGWSRTSAVERSRILVRLSDLIDSNLRPFAAAESRDTGKPIRLATEVDIPRAAANLRFFATSILHTEGQCHEFDGGGVPRGVPALNYTLRKPRGVAACISPWNLPLYLLTWKIAPALATGNTVVAKPSEVTPVTASMFGDLAAEAGLPPGVLNIVHGTGPRAGAALVRHPDVPTVTFTGSTTVGRWIGRECGEQLKRVSLELGGKNPFIIFDDADVDRAILTAGRAAFTNQGQICLCGSRVLAHHSIFERVVEGLVAHATKLTIGDPQLTTTEFGALTSRPHFEKVAAAVNLARELGGVVHCGGGPVADLPERCRSGYFYAPTVISGLNPSCRVEQEEIFGPVVTVQPFRDESEALILANSTPYGLAATLFTRDVSRAHRIAAAVESGIVWINCWMVRDLRTPFGGVKDSGIGREGGLEALRFFTEPKNVCIGLSCE
ncbi:MAG: aldehyde dehydrogenase [Phycisphaerae bacterium]|nr:aldehyde dehydrogenase [Phycisphaerae bacterium]